MDTVTDAPRAGLKLLNLDAVKAGKVSTEPYRYVICERVLDADAATAIRRDFPETTSVGFLNSTDLTREGAYAALLDDLESPELAAVLSEKLDLDLSKAGRLITVRRWSRKTDGRIHTDSQRKISTFLVYLNETWSAADSGAFRVLRGEKDFEDYVAEVPPIQGNAVGFKRADHSWHGHKPFEGERLVVQLTYLQDAEAAEHKRRAAGIQGFMKKLFERVG
jgi:SM-20-related protein